jgi:hypothetical protein
MEHRALRWIVDLMEDATLYGWWAALCKRVRK